MTFDEFFDFFHVFLLENPSINYRRIPLKLPGKSLKKSSEIQRKRTLEKIFEFYCKTMCKIETFEGFSPENSTMNLKIFSKFLKDFNVLNKNFSKTVKKPFFSLENSFFSKETR